MSLMIAAGCMAIIEAMSRCLSGDIAWYFAQWSQIFMCLVWVSVLFTHVPKNKINIRSVIAIILVSYIVSVATYPLWIFYPSAYIYALVLYFPLLYFALKHTASRTYKFRSDPIRGNNVYICLWKPEKAASLFESLIGAPIGSVCLYANGYIYCFRWGAKEYAKKPVTTSAVLRKFIVIDSGVKANAAICSKMDSLIGNKARAWRSLWLRCRCIFIIKPVLVRMGDDFRPRLFEFIPSLYAARLLRSRGKNE